LDKLNILIVEKDVTLAKELQELLTDMGFNVKLANSVEAILDLVGNNSFDLIFLDASFPEVSGVKVFQDIKYSHPNCKTILCYNSYSHQIKRIVTDLGVAATIQKPFELDSLLEIFHSNSRLGNMQNKII
jgi:DNA-binding NtrC family response regulator